MSVVSFREYEPIRVLHDLPDPDEPALSVRELEILDQVGARLGLRLVEHLSRNLVRPRQFVGTIQMPTRSVEFLPKIETGADDLPVVRHNLLEMLLVAYDLGGASPGAAGLSHRSVGWLDLLILLFCRALADQVRRGLVRRYRTEEDDLASVRGRLLIDAQLTQNLIHRERVACEFDELDENNSLNQVFKRTVWLMLRVASNVGTQQAVRELVPAFEGVADVPLSKPLIDGIKLDRLSERFGFCLSLAKLFLQGLTTDLYSGAQQSFALMFDMGELFERYVGKLTQKAVRPLGYEALLQNSKHYLARDQQTQQRLFQMRPDIVVTFEGEPTCIVDTKWKRLQPGQRKLGVDQADLYQMLAYSERYQCQSILLLYPWTHATGEFLGVHKRMRFEGKTTKVTVGEIALDDLRTVPSQIRRLVEDCMTDVGLTGE